MPFWCAVTDPELGFGVLQMEGWNTDLPRVIIKMALVTERLVQPLGGAHFPMSHAIVGSVIPGELRRYPVKIVNYHNLTSAIRHRKKPVDPVKQFPHMGDEHSKGNSMMDQLKKMLQSKGGPIHKLKTEMRKGYERMKEDLSWRGTTNVAPTPPNTGAPVFGV